MFDVRCSSPTGAARSPAVAGCAAYLPPAEPGQAPGTEVAAVAGGAYAARIELERFFPAVSGAEDAGGLHVGRVQVEGRETDGADGSKGALAAVADGMSGLGEDLQVAGPVVSAVTVGVMDGDGEGQDLAGDELGQGPMVAERNPVRGREAGVAAAAMSRAERVLLEPPHFRQVWMSRRF